MRPLDPTDAGRAMQRLRLEWTYHSNAIEGNSLTYSETRILLLEGLTAHGKPLKDSLDIKRHREVIEHIESLVRTDEPIRLDLIKEIHFRLMDETYEVEAETSSGDRVRRTMRGGDFKELPNNVRTPTGETHYYAPPIEVPGRMADLLGWVAGDEASALHPVARLAVFHHRFVEIHPFPDGNGRTARMLTNLLLMREGYVPAVLRQERRSIYYAALTAAGAGDDELIVAFVAEELSETMELYLRALRGEPDPDAFSRRAALLNREVVTMPSGEVSQEKRGLLFRKFLSPLFETTRSRLAEMASSFGSYEEEIVATDSSDQDRKGEQALEVLDAGLWRAFVWTGTLSALAVDPSVSVPVTYRGTVGASGVRLTALPGSKGPWTYSGAFLPGETDAVEVAEEVLEVALEVAERAVRRVRDRTD
ncbi:Fic family protein [Rubrivirga sp.]|uniref:Fic family protein n=1 Tax=Rubrivirga sp. TaxID=1885344 RepID=UPI003B5202D8